MIVEPPGEPSARNGLPFLRMIVGEIDDRGRLSGWIRFGSAGSYTAEKSVSSLFSRKPRPGSSIPEPPVCSMVRVYSTMLPHLSVTVRFVVSTFSVSGALVPRAAVRLRARAVVAVDVARRHRRRERVVLVDLAGPLGAVRRGEQVGGRDVHELRVADVRRAVGERQRGRLEVVVQRGAHVHRPERELLHDVQRLTDRGAAGRRPRHAVDVVAAVAHVGGPAGHGVGSARGRCPAWCPS